MTALISCVVGAAAVVGYVQLSAPPELSPAIAAATGPRAPTEPEGVVDDGTWTQEDRRHCKSQAAAAAEAAAERRLLAVSNDRVGLGGPSDSMMGRSAELLCNATRKPSHLCESYWQKQFIEAIKEYAKDFRGISQQAYWTQHNIAQRARRRTGTDQVAWEAAADDLRQTTRDLARMNEDVTAAFRSLIAEGIIDPDDFGVFFGLGIPPDIAKMIGDVRPLRDRCG